MILACLVTEPFQSNCWIVGCEETLEAVIIDPGDEAGIFNILKEHRLKRKSLIHTHGHLDHVSATAAVQRRTGAHALIHQADQTLLDNLPLQAAMFGLTPPGRPIIDQYIQEGDWIAFGKYTLSVLETPGHSPGGVCLELVGEGVLFAGDTLFRRSIGRTDLWGGSYQQLLNSIRKKLWPLPDDIIVYSGHGPATTIGEEKRNNPFLQGV
jgi:glyoxylase-like metal-dependent hydrolase (beta-lactamase superfamily II)